jgi:hypothetical protein
MTTKTFALKPANDDGDPLIDGTGGSQRMPDDCISVSGTTVTAYIKEPGRGIPYWFYVQGSGYDWIYYVGENGSGFTWDATVEYAGFTGAWKSEPPVEGSSVNMTDQPSAPPTHAIVRRTYSYNPSDPPSSNPVIVFQPGGETLSWGANAVAVSDYVDSVSITSIDPKILAVHLFRIGMKRVV